MDTKDNNKDVQMLKNKIWSRWQIMAEVTIIQRNQVVEETTLLEKIWKNSTKETWEERWSILEKRWSCLCWRKNIHSKQQKNTRASSTSKSWSSRLSRSLTVDFILFSFFIFILLYFSFSFNFLFLEQLGLGVISHAVTSVTKVDGVITRLITGLRRMK